MNSANVPTFGSSRHADVRLVDPQPALAWPVQHCEMIRLGRPPEDAGPIAAFLVLDRSLDVSGNAVGVASIFANHEHLDLRPVDELVGVAVVGEEEAPDAELNRGPWGGAIDPNC